MLGFAKHWVKLKGCGKSAPPQGQPSGQGKPHPEQDQIGTAYDESYHRCSGVSLEGVGNSAPRGMIVTRKSTKPGLSTL